MFFLEIFLKRLFPGLTDLPKYESFTKNSPNPSAQTEHPENEQEIFLSQIGRKDDFIGAP